MAPFLEEWRKYPESGGPLFIAPFLELYFRRPLRPDRQLGSPCLLAFRDIKGDNIMVDSTGHIVLIDFAFAVELRAGHKSALMRGGTVCYWAPEMLRTKEPKVSPATDYFACCVMAMELLSGVVIFSSFLRSNSTFM